MNDASIFSVVSVDAVALAYERENRQILLGVHHRAAPSFEGELALPGVVLRSGERLERAASRAIAKLGLPSPGQALGQLRTFDEPSRDPRGPSLSVAMWAAYPPRPSPIPGRSGSRWTQPTTSHSIMMRSSPTDAGFWPECSGVI